jgi:SAM-dependent methyltransferase
MKVYNQNANRLIEYENNATQEHWDRHWQDNHNIQFKARPRTIITEITNKYLVANSLILEGGCGNGQNIADLQAWNFKVIGIDNAAVTINYINEHYPQLVAQLGDIEKLDFPDNHFDGYWSLGVIEHFIDGYDRSIAEMHRVVRPGGYIFITIPHLSIIRRVKIYLGSYPIEEGPIKKDSFYQYYLDHKKTVKDLERLGFQLKLARPLDGIKGLKDESCFLRPLLRKIYNSPALVNKILRKLLSPLLAFFSSHIILLVMQKKYE